MDTPRYKLAPEPVYTLLPTTLQQFPNRIFVETGTKDGSAILRALDAGFKRIISIELDPGRYLAALDRFGDIGRVMLFQGSSAEILWPLIQNIDEPITFWLDAHAEPNETGQPLLEELAAIAKHPIKRHTILVDDRRMMGTAGCWAETTEEAVLGALRMINANYEFSRQNSVNALQDILVAVPPKEVTHGS